METALFDFTLPDELIAHHPLKMRNQSRLLHVKNVEINDKMVDDLTILLDENDVLVFNNSRVIPARLYGRRGAMAVEVLLHQQNITNIAPNQWRVFARPTKRLHIDDIIHFSDDFAAKLVEKLPSGEVVLDFLCATEAFWQQLEIHGNIPLPPYIKRDAEIEDIERYQTVYAKHNGSVAAPTAGLHFSNELLAQLAARQIEQYFITLHVGGGTFMPVKVENTADHIMHSEQAIISAEVATKLNIAKQNGKNIVAVGTTAMRTLESATDENGMLQPFNAPTDIFITPPYQFKFVDKLITNFHLPKSTLFMLVSAFCGLEQMQAAYAHAIKQKYRFYSYGDACLLEKY